MRKLRTIPLLLVTLANIGSFSGKVLTTSATISVTGRIQFGRGQGMQGVNVVLRPLVEGVPDACYTATAVSGALFRGNAGNPVTGTVDEHGKSLNRSGSDDLSLEGYFDLSGVPLPPGLESADYQLTFEALNPLYTRSSSVGPYVSSQVRPSGTMPTINLGVLRAGSVAAQTVVIEDAAAEVQSGSDGDESAPASIPASGEWTGRLTGYGHTAWFSFHARASREFTIEAEPLDERGSSTDEKALIVIGAWNGVDAPGTLPVTATVQPFNGQIAGLTTLPVLMIADSDVRVGLADLRGDGRPDFAYRGRVLYAESVSPTRLPSAGGEIVIRGMGFRSSTRVSVGGLPATVVSISPTLIVANAPPSRAITGTVALQLQDTKTLAVAVIADQLSYDCGTDDALSIMTAPMNAVPIGIPQPFTIRAVRAGNDSPATGVMVAFSMTQGKAALACGLSTCRASTAGDGTATLLVTPTSSEPAQVTASLSNGRSVIAEFTGTAPPSIAALTPNVCVAFGASVRWPVAAMVLNGSGTPPAGQSITWSAASHGVSFSAAQTTSNAIGVVVNEISAGPFDTSVSVTVNACLTAKLACTSFELVPVHPRTAVLQPWNGTSQYVPANETFSPSVIRVTDAFGHPLAGAAVTVAEAFYGWTAGCPPQSRCPPAPLLAQQTRTLVSDLDGMVSFVPLSAGGLSGRLFVTASTAGPSALSFVLDAHP